MSSETPVTYFPSYSMTDVSAPSSEDRSTAGSTPTTTNYRPLRIWPAVLLLAGMLLCRYVPGMWEDAPSNIWMVSAMGPAACGALILLWFLLFSRASLTERLIGLLGLGAVGGLSLALADSSMREIPPIIGMIIPLGMGAFAVALVLLSRMRPTGRTWLALLVAVPAFGSAMLYRNHGLYGEFSLDLESRLGMSAEEELVAMKASAPDSGVATDDFDASELQQWLAEPEWPSFRGPDRDGSAGVSLAETDWTREPPKQLWKIPVGPGWSSFSVAGKLLFTQEQRGDRETIVCYKLDTGDEIWATGIESRFVDNLGGDGPRATPTIAQADLFVMGASGQLMRLDAESGEVLWETDLREVADRDPPTWGFCSSPLVVGDCVVVHAGGEGDRGTLAFDIESGELRWSAPAGDHSYASPQICTVNGNDYITILTNTGVDLLEPTTGDVKMAYEWKHEGYRSLQPQIVGQDTILMPTGMGAGTRAIRVVESDGELQADELWTSTKLKPDFNDLVAHEGFAYGFDGAIFTCIDLATGERQWKRGRYGKGQVLLLKENGLLLVATEHGKIVLLRADPSGHQEVAEFEAIEGRTWNHPVVVDDRLLVRNSAEAACFELPTSDSES